MNESAALFFRFVESDSRDIGENPKTCVGKIALFGEDSEKTNFFSQYLINFFSLYFSLPL